MWHFIFTDKHVVLFTADRLRKHHELAHRATERRKFSWNIVTRQLVSTFICCKLFGSHCRLLIDSLMLLFNLLFLLSFLLVLSLSLAPSIFPQIFPAIDYLYTFWTAFTAHATLHCILRLITFWGSLVLFSLLLLVSFYHSSGLYWLLSHFYDE